MVIVLGGLAEVAKKYVKRRKGGMSMRRSWNSAILPLLLWLAFPGVEEEVMVVSVVAALVRIAD